MVRMTTFCLCLLSLFLAGCSTPSYVVLLDNPDGSTGKVLVQGKKGNQVLDKAFTGVALDGSQAATTISKEKLEKDFGAAMAARPLLPKRFLLYFDTGGTKLTTESLALLPRIIEASGQMPALDVSVIGHTDTMGKPELNERLALARAQFVADLISSKGLKTLALTVESHGERNLLVQTADETPEPRNRRVEISLR